jgi:glycerol-3-phosphate dehydrogenase subunit C
MSRADRREGSLEAPTRHAIDWKSADYFDPASLQHELERVFDICHGCRRCFNLCNAFPTLFDAVDATPTGEVAEVPHTAFAEVVEHCYLCDMCYMTKCPYVPPHPWNVDFPHLMLRAKAQSFRAGTVKTGARLLANTDAIGRLAGIPVVVEAMNAVNRSPAGRKLLEKTLGVHRDAYVPDYHRDDLRSRVAQREGTALTPQPTEATRGRVALFATCYGQRNEPELGEDLIAVFEHNGIPVELATRERCCGMPKLELGDLDGIRRLKEENIPVLAQLVGAGFDLVAPIPSCVLMFKQELPLLFADDADVKRVAAAIFDPFQYLMLRHRAGKLRTDFVRPLGKVAYHVACHLRVQNLGQKTRELLELVPGTEVESIERCAGHNGTYGVRREFHETAMRIGRPVMQRIEQSGCDHYTSDCPLAGHHLGRGLSEERPPTHPLRLLRMAYGLLESAT